MLKDRKGCLRRINFGIAWWGGWWRWILHATFMRAVTCSGDVSAAWARRLLLHAVVVSHEKIDIIGYVKNIGV